MEIGGDDVLIENNMPFDRAEAVALDAIRSFWPDLTVEHDSSLGMREIFVYENQAAQDGWDRYGLNEEKMIYLIFQEGLTTVVHEDDEPIVEAIRKGLTCGN